LRGEKIIIANIISFLAILLVVYISTISHELAHGFVAYKLGDPTAKFAGRLTFNPLKHIDLIGTILLPIMLKIAGFIPLIILKPVPINPAFFRNRNIDSIKVALAGPFINLFYVFITAIIIRISLNINTISNSILFKIFVYYFGIWIIMINLILASFNLIPFPPLDGSWVIISILPLKAKLFYEKIKTYIIILFLVLIVTGKLNFIFNFLLKFFKSLTLKLIGL